MTSRCALTRQRIPLSDSDSSSAVSLSVLASAASSGSTSRPFLLIHGLASNALLWQPVAERLVRAGHPVVAVDLRGHGESDQPEGGYDTVTAANDVAQLISALGWVGADSPVICGQSWGAHVALHTAHDSHTAHSVACVDGGWFTLSDGFDSFEECWTALAPPDLSEASYSQLRDRIAGMVSEWPAGSLDLVMGNLQELPGNKVRNRLLPEHHRDILHSMWLEDREQLRLVDIPVLFLVAGSPDDPTKSTAVARATDELPDVQAQWFPGAHHDLHTERPDVVAVALLDFLRKGSP